MNLQVITCAVFANREIAEKKLWIFLASCKKFGIEPHLYGVGHPWTLYRHIKITLQLEYLKGMDCSHVLYTDGWDAFFCAPLDEIKWKYRLYGSPPILLSAYKQLGNADAKNYPGCFDSEILYRYPNVGGWIGERDAMIDVFEKMEAMNESGKEEHCTADDCFDFYTGWKEGWFRPTLDYMCHIFNVTDEHLQMAISDGRMRPMNIMTGSRPAILHLSGGYSSPDTGKDDRMKPWAERVGII